MAKQITEQEFEQDPLLRSYAKIEKFYLENKSTIIGIGIAIVLLVALGIGYNYYSKAQEQKAQQLMGYAETYYLNGEYELALKGSEEDFTVGFEQIIRNYGNTDTGNLAHYYAAVSEYRLGNTQQAMDYIEDYEVPAGILGVAPLSFRAVLYTAVGDHEKAAKTYVKAAEWDKNESTTPFNYLEAARSFEDAGNPKQAQAFARRIVSEYPNSSEVEAANKILGKATIASS